MQTGNKRKEHSKRKMSSKENQSYPREYEKKRNIATKICRNKKKQWLNNKIKETEDAHRKNETRKFYKDIKAYSRVDQCGTLLLCKDEKGNVMTEKQQVLERWKQYFKEVLNEHTNREIEIKI